MDNVIRVQNGTFTQAIIQGKTVELIDNGHHQYSKVVREDGTVTLVGVGLTTSVDTKLSKELVQINSATESDLVAWANALGNTEVARKLSHTNVIMPEGGWGRAADTAKVVLTHRQEQGLVEVSG